MRGKVPLWLSPAVRDPRTPRQQIADNMRATAARTKGTNTLEGLREHLKRRYGNLIRAWRLAIDIEGTWKLSFNDFGPAIRRLGYEGSIRQMWTELDADSDGVVTLREFAPKLSELIIRFAQFLRERFKSADEAWSTFAPRGKRLLDLNEFTYACSAMGWTQDVQTLHNALDSSPGRGNISQRDFEWLGLQKKQRREILDEIHKAELKAIEDDRYGRVAPRTVEEFRAMMKRRYGNTVRAWRLALDKDAVSRITYYEFGGNVRTLGFDGSIRALWAELTQNKQTMTLKELCASSAVRLERFKVWMRGRFETAEDAWNSISRPGQKFVTEKRFCEGVKLLGWRESPRAIHRWLDSAPARTGFVTVRDLEWLGLFETGCDTTSYDGNLSPAEDDDELPAYSGQSSKQGTFNPYARAPQRGPASSRDPVV
jgi:Ca2+-binding EF-hand superfamily protein